MAMTNEEKKAQMERRNEAICDFYKAGHKVSDCASKFKLGRQRITQILQAGGVWKPYEKSDRTKFLGVSVSEETKEALGRIAEQRGERSVSKLTSDLLDEFVQREAVK